jgi:plasmid stabilization system protein ParE
MNVRRTGLGREFLDELEAVLTRIADTPEMCAAGYRGVRSIRLHRLYVLHYRFINEIVVVLAVMFGGRDPSAWRGRA